MAAVDAAAAAKDADMKNKAKFLWIIPIVIVVLDQVAKYFVINNLIISEQLTLIPGFLSIMKIYNSGIILGMYFHNNNLIAIISLMLVCIISIFVFLSQSGKIKSHLSRVTLVAFHLIIGGAISNIIDRILHSSVVDYIHLDFINFPIFNIADIAITSAAILLIWEILFGADIANKK